MKPGRTTTREILPNRRENYTQRFRIAGNTVHLTAGMYPDGRLGEVFIDLSKQGTALRFWGESTATLFSLAIQCGCPLETLVDLFVGSKSEPFGIVEGHARITKCTSIMDAIARSLAIDFLGRDDLADR